MTAIYIYIYYVFEVFVYNNGATQSIGIRFIIILSLLLLIIYACNYIYDSDDTMQILLNYDERTIIIKVKKILRGITWSIATMLIFLLFFL